MDSLLLLFACIFGGVECELLDIVKLIEFLKFNKSIRCVVAGEYTDRMVDVILPPLEPLVIGRT